MAIRGGVLAWSLLSGCALVSACAGGRASSRPEVEVPAWVNTVPAEGAVGTCDWTPLGTQKQRELAQERALATLAKARVGSRVRVQETFQRDANNQRDVSTLDSTQTVEVDVKNLKASIRAEWTHPETQAYWVWMVAE